MQGIVELESKMIHLLSRPLFDCEPGRSAQQSHQGLLGFSDRRLNKHRGLCPWAKSQQKQKSTGVQPVFGLSLYELYLYSIRTWEPQNYPS